MASKAGQRPHLKSDACFIFCPVVGERILLGMGRMRMIRVSLVVAAVVLLAGCASGNLAPEAAQLDAKRFEVPAGKSSIYIYRADQFFVSTVLSEVYLDGELIAVVGPGNFVRIDVKPGKHTVLSKGGGINPPIPAKTAIDARANRLHFLGTWMVMGFSTNSIAHKIVSKEKGINDLNRSKMVETF